jgi:hypothetical protein
VIFPRERASTGVWCVILGSNPSGVARRKTQMLSGHVAVRAGNLFR